MKSTEKCENWLSDYRQKANIKPTLVYEGRKGATTVMQDVLLASRQYTNDQLFD